MITDARKPPAVEPLLVDALVAARMLSISPRTLWSLSRSGVIPVVRLGKRTLYRPAALAAAIAELERSAAPSSP